jgi:hypothetical protein
MKGLRGQFRLMVDFCKWYGGCLACALSWTTRKGTVIPAWSNSATFRWGKANLLKESIAMTSDLAEN